MIRKPSGFRNANQLRRPQFPVPEDIFASDDQVAERHEQEIRSPAIDRAINDWNDAKEQSSISAFFHTGSLKGMEEGDEVYAGQHVGYSDDSGVGRPHTHYSYFPPGTPIDPRTGLPMRGNDDHDRNAPARTQVDTFGPQGPYHRSTRNRPPVFFKP
jgi:hypothetical protein